MEKRGDPEELAAGCRKYGTAVQPPEREKGGVLEKLQVRAKGRKVIKGSERYQLREPQAAYNAHFTPEKTNIALYLGVF